jgi:hypothetical protein
MYSSYDEALLQKNDIWKRNTVMVSSVSREKLVVKTAEH